jgi:2-amino-4-hydroxy-6-hydroxymethyldihydropteridine diphosphokinase
VTLAYIGLGSNLAEPRTQVETAFQELDALPHSRLAARSSLYRSAPMGHSAQPDFVNAVAALDTGLNAHGLLDGLQAIESRHARTRSFRDAPRTLDLDLLLFGEERMSEERLVIPHPRMHERAFVLLPLLEIAPGVQVPGHGAARSLLARCAAQKVERLAP